MSIPYFLSNFAPESMKPRFDAANARFVHNFQSQLLVYKLIMDEREWNDEVESDGEEYQLPPVELPKRAVTSVKSVKESIITVPNLFNEEKLEVDSGSIECLEFLTDGAYVAAGCSTGFIKVVSTSQKNVQYVLLGSDNSPVTGLAYNPNKETLRNAFMATHSDGTLEYWHATSRQLLFQKKYDEMLQTCEISPTGSHYAVAGQLGRVLVGQLNKGEAHDLETGHLGTHQNRIFCLKWNPFDPNVLLSGGWDRAVHFWDIRTKTSVKRLFGYYIGGQAIDFRENEVLLGNNKPQNPLRIYDIKADKIRSIQWDLTNEKQSHYVTGVLGCFFTSGQKIFACTPKNEIRLYEGDKLISEYRNTQEDTRLYCMQKTAADHRIITGWNDGTIRWLFV